MENEQNDSASGQQGSDSGGEPTVLRCGRWTGHWLQVGRRYDFDVEITFEKGIVRGRGLDATGPFTIHGHCTPDGEGVFFAKMTGGGGGQPISYSGSWHPDASCLGGIWRMPLGGTGRFWMYPPAQ